MRTVVVLVLIVLAAGGWYWHSKHRARAMDQGVPVLAGPAGTAGTVSTPSLAGGSTPTLAGPELSSGSVETPAADAPAAVKDALAKADAMWTTINGDPTAASAPSVALLYSQVLRGLYGQPGQHEREVALVTTRLTPLGQALFFTKTRYADEPSDLFDVHVTAPGESPDPIARKYGMSSQLLNRLRGRDANDGRLNAGDALKVVKIKDHNGFYLHIDKSHFCLDCFVAGVFAKRYPISHGSVQTPTPTGKTHITIREWHPNWTHPVTHKEIPYGDPANVLGPIWLQFDAQELGQEGIGIHGYTGENAGPGQLASNGCIRLLNDDAVELYNTLSSPERAPIAVEISN